MITSVPSSKAKNDPDYDSRFEDLFTELLKSRPNLSDEWPVTIKKTVRTSRHGGPREPTLIKQNYKWNGFKKTTPPKILCIFDDVLTTGAHFRAMSDFLRENDYKGKIVGIFWAKTVWPSLEENEEWVKLNKNI